MGYLGTASKGCKDIYRELLVLERFSLRCPGGRLCTVSEMRLINGADSSAHYMEAARKERDGGGSYE
jgi:hypothetical protein